MHADNRKKDILVLCEGPTDGLDDTSVTAEAKYSVNITMSREKICLSLHYNAVNSFLHDGSVKIGQSKAQDSEIKPQPLCLGNISQIDNMDKTGLNGKVYDISVSYETTDASDIEDIHKYLMKKHNIV